MNDEKADAYGGDSADPVASHEKILAQAGTPSPVSRASLEQPTQGLFITLFHSSLRKHATQLVDATKLEVSLNPVACDLVTVAGPDIARPIHLSASNHHLESKIRRRFAAEVRNWEPQANARVVLGVVVVGSSATQVEHLITMLTQSTARATLPVLVRGLAIDEDGGGIKDERVLALTPQSPTRPYEAVTRLMIDMCAEAEGGEWSTLSLSHVHALTGTVPPVEVESDVVSEVAPVQREEEQVSAVDDRYLSSTKGEEIQTLYLAVASGLESRSREVYSRAEELCVAIDRNWHQLSGAGPAQTWVLELGRQSEPFAVEGGQLGRTAIRKPSHKRTDLVDELKRTATIIREVSNSYSRRGERTTFPIAIFVIPALPFSVLRLKDAVKKLQALADPWWIIVGAASEADLGNLPKDRAFLDKADVVNEVIFQAMLERSERLGEGTGAESQDVDVEEEVGVGHLMADVQPADD